MVNSNINKSIIYSEIETISTDDREYSANIYEIVIDDNTILIALGQEKHKFVTENIVYFPIYLVLQNNTVKQIGVYETNLSKLSSLFDEDGDIDITLFGGPLLFSGYHKLFNQAKDPTIESDNSDSETPSHKLNKNPIDNNKYDNENANEEDGDQVRIIKIMKILLLPNYLLLKKNSNINNSEYMMKLNMLILKYYLNKP